MTLKTCIASIALLIQSVNVFAQDLVFAVPPRGSIEKERVLYQPIVDFLSKVTGQKVVFRYTDNYLTYENDMRKDEYDFVFDGPGFIGWRMAKLGHTPLIKLDGKLDFVVIARTDNERIKTLKDLAGRSVCAFAPPNLATLTMYEQFTNPARQPRVVEIKTLKEAYSDVIDGKCEGGVLQAPLYAKFDEGANKGHTKVLFKSKPMPNQGISVSRRISPELQQKIAEALLSAAGQAATKNLRQEFKKEFVLATRPEFEGLGSLLKDVWGFAL